MLGRAVAQRFDAGFPPRLPRFAYGQHVGFVVDKVALGQVFSEYFGFPCQSFHRFSIIIINWGWHNRPLSGRSVEWTLIPPPTMQIKKKALCYKSEGRGMASRWGGFFSNLPNPSGRTMALVSTQPLTEMNTRNLPGGKVRRARRADNLATIC
jgi:hypothetical protein